MGRLLLVRHGQASFGAEDYDVLSPTGEEQARVLGRWLAERVERPAAVVHGAMQRQLRTAEELTDAAGWSLTPSLAAGWDEIDHVDVLSRQPETPDYQDWFEVATQRWMSGDFDAEYRESFAGFAARVEAALAAALEVDGLVVAVTSGGPISWVCAGLLDAGLPTYRRLARVVVNTGVTTVVTGRRGTNLLTFNDHAHLPADLLTYR
ncbi:phosphoglycerate mutase [Nocardioides mangrovicus]|uniref:Phosphoglycerate mutase n=1 Tax=Nocardioides mangrovicus TaxID=2478913 RepID=A0A3L8NXY5_9ACTN|nr:histidine phosphatase family protein [Nocardioides mangrovicus]RLV48000.1 phosphoglycerate mutase [Nocardioides mangrovicus]